MITSCTQRNPRTRTQSNTLHANATASLRLLQTQRSSFSSQQARIKPPQRPPQTMNRACMDVKRLYDWTRKSSTSNGLTRSRGTASRTFEAPRTFSHHRDSGLRSGKPNMPYSVPFIVFSGPSSPASKSAWKVLVLSSWLLLGRPAINASESNCAHFLEVRLDLFWSEDWPAFWATVRAECDVARLQHLTQFSCRTETVTCPQSCHPCPVRRTRTRPGVSVARRLMLPQPAASDPQVLFWHAPNKRAARQICGKPVDADQHHRFGCRCGGGVNRRHAAVARCLADVIHSHNSTKMYIEQAVPSSHSCGEWSGHGSCLSSKRHHHVPRCRHCLSVVQQPSPHCGSQETTKPRGPESRILFHSSWRLTDRPGFHAKKFIINLMKDADAPSSLLLRHPSSPLLPHHPPPPPPPLAIRDTWPAIQSVLHSAISKQQLTATTT